MYEADLSQHYKLQLGTMQRSFCHSNLLDMKDKVHICCLFTRHQQSHTSLTRSWISVIRRITDNHAQGERAPQ